MSQEFDRYSLGQADVVTLGESMILFQTLTEGPIQYAPLFTRTIAGAESNVAVGLTRLGKKVRFISRVGQDPFGQVIVSTLAGEGIDVSHVIRDPEAPTAVFFKEIKGTGDPMIYYYRKGSAASRFSPADVRPEWFEGARHLHVTGITPALGAHTAETVSASMRLAKKMGLSVSFDPNLRRKLWTEEQARSTLLGLIPFCDIFLPGLDEAEFLLGGHSEDTYGERFLEMGPKIVALKLGEQGSMGFVKNASIRVPGYPVGQVVDTVGAGDAFAAALMSVVLEEDFRTLDSNSLIKLTERGLKRANITGALATQYKGDWEGFPSLQELIRIEAGQQQISR